MTSEDASMVDRPVRFDATLVAGTNARAYVPVPFDPDDVWGAKVEHRVAAP
jgi:hypothetical protein